MRFFLAVFVCCFVLQPIVSAQTSEDECLIMSSRGKTNIVTNIIAIFQQYGICIEIKKLPRKRADRMLLNNEIDGEFPRMASYNTAMKDTVIMVPTSLYTVKHYLISTDPDIHSIEDIKPGDYLYLNDSQLDKDFMGKYQLTGTSTYSIKAIPRLLKLGRGKVFYYVEYYYKTMKSQLPAHHVILVNNLEHYIFLHKSNQGRVKELNKIIIKHLASGGTFLPN